MTLVLIRGADDIASTIALKLFRAGTVYCVIGPGPSMRADRALIDALFEGRGHSRASLQTLTPPGRHPTRRAPAGEVVDHPDLNGWKLGFLARGQAPASRPCRIEDEFRRAWRADGVVIAADGDSRENGRSVAALRERD